MKISKKQDFGHCKHNSWNFFAKIESAQIRGTFVHGKTHTYVAHKRKYRDMNSRENLGGPFIEFHSRHGILCEFQTEEEDTKKVTFPSKLYLRSPEQMQMHAVCSVVCSACQFLQFAVFTELAQEVG